MYVISSCLLGHNCKYNGGNNRCQEVIDFCEKKKYVAVCPERVGGLPCPRPPAERQENRIVDKEGNDVTEAFEKGAALSLGTCRMAVGCSDGSGHGGHGGHLGHGGQTLEGAILKANSPSCGCGRIYDGTFTGTLTEGNGVFAEMLLREGIPVISEKDTEKIKAWLDEKK